ncbi:MAG: 5-bromo-4-chloroindolyl phosphate hydrolysis family protein [Erysipelotrichaceae bacterium]|nr:5-bromo-4-chloroindolyl phosphate hydrolysis family protein [Erysipelotrichaceae bacterium]
MEDNRQRTKTRVYSRYDSDYDQFVDLYRMLQDVFVSSSYTVNQHKEQNAQAQAQAQTQTQAQTPPTPPKEEVKKEEKRIVSRTKLRLIEEQMNQKISTGKTMMIIGAVTMFVLGWIGFISLGLLIYGYMMFRQGKDTQSAMVRFNQYYRVLKRKDPATVEELAKAANVPTNYVLSDLQQMIDKGLFMQGHLDRANNLMYVSDDMYEEGVDVEQVQPAKEEVVSAKEEVEDIFDEDAAPESVRKTVIKAEKNIQKMQRRKKQIKSQYVKGQLDEMEATLRQIIEYVIAHPNTADGIDKLMKYYLPTSIKLLDTYRDLEAQTIQGGNIAKSKKDIEEVLVTLNQGYKILLDDLFKDTSMDVTSDISVLESLLAQEGLTNEGIKEKETVE